MGHERSEAAATELIGRGGEPGVEPVERRLEEQPASAARSVRDQLELVIGEALDHPVGDLSAGENAERDVFTTQPRCELGDTLRYLTGIHDVLWMDMRRYDHRARPISDGRCGQRQAVLDQTGPVVDARQEMEMQLDVIHAGTMFDAGRRHPVTIA